jgi:hypothetical protein
MKPALKLSILLSGSRQLPSPDFFARWQVSILVDPFAQVINHLEYRDLEHLFHVWVSWLSVKWRSDVLR